jgi:PST family polysaccharide transporter
LGFAFPLQLAALAATAAAKGSGLAVSVMFGPAAMGLFTLAFNLAQIPADNIGESLADVLLPSFARLDPDRRPEALARAMPLVALLVFPLAVGLGVEAHPIVSTFFNPRWQPMAPLLTVLAVLGVVYPMGAAVQAFLKASGRPKAVLGFHVSHVLLLLSFVTTLGHLGLVWAAVAPGLAGGCYAMLTLAYVGRVERVPVRKVLAGIGRVIVACLGMATAVLIFRRIHGHGNTHGSFGFLAAEVGLGVLAYVAMVFLVAAPQVHDLLSSLSRLREKRHPTPGVVLDAKLQAREGDG